jgi:hypothetical protein
MTANSASNFLDRGWQLQEATRYATRVFKRLLYIACSHSDEFHPEMTGAIEGFEQELFDQLETVKQVTQEFHKIRLVYQDHSARQRLSLLSSFAGLDRPAQTED